MTFFIDIVFYSKQNAKLAKLQYSLLNKLKGGPFDFWGGEGLEDFEKKFPAIQRERKKIMQHTIEIKKYHAKESAQKKFLHVNLLTFFTSVLRPQACKILHFWAGTYA
jgi:hypothetical protein